MLSGDLSAGPLNREPLKRTPSCHTSLDFLAGMFTSVSPTKGEDHIIHTLNPVQQIKSYSGVMCKPGNHWMIPQPVVNCIQAAANAILHSESICLGPEDRDRCRIKPDF